MLPPSSLDRIIALTVREEWGRILASLIKSTGDFQRAEDCLQDAVLAAMTDWSRNGIPKSPAAWLITTARRRAIDRMRRDARFLKHQPELSYLADLENLPDPEDDSALPDKRLEMIFTCCHPALDEKTRVALTLRTLGGLTTDEIAAAYLDRPPAMAQRLVRAKKKIAGAGIPYQIPDADVLPERLTSVMQVIYLIFNAGYSAAAGDTLTRPDLSNEAIRLARILRSLLPFNGELEGLLALMLLHNSRRNARTSETGGMIPLEHQNRARWDRAPIAEGQAILQGVLPRGSVGPYQVQAAISAVHAEARDWQATDWAQIADLYDLLYRLQPTPVVRINLAYAVSHAGRLQDGLAILQDVGATGALDNYQPYHAVRADMLSRAGNIQDARVAFDRAIDLTDNAREKEFLRDRLAAL